VGCPLLVNILDGCLNIEVLKERAGLLLSFAWPAVNPNFVHQEETCFQVLRCKRVESYRESRTFASQQVIMKRLSMCAYVGAVTVFNTRDVQLSGLVNVFSQELQLGGRRFSELFPRVVPAAHHFLNCGLDPSLLLVGQFLQEGEVPSQIGFQNPTPLNGDCGEYAKKRTGLRRCGLQPGFQFPLVTHELVESSRVRDHTQLR